MDLPFAIAVITLVFSICICYIYLLTQRLNRLQAQVMHGKHRRATWGKSHEIVNELQPQFIIKNALYQSGFIPNKRNGHLLFFQEWQPKDLNKAKGIICMCHGFADHNLWLKKTLIVPLVEAGYVFITFDQEGHGLSDGLHVYIERKENLHRDGATVFTHRLAQLPNHLPRFLLGESMGGAVALLISLYEDIKWNGMILLAPMLSFPIKLSNFEKTLLSFLSNSSFFSKLPIIPSKSMTDRIFKLEEIRKIVRKNPLLYPQGLGTRCRTAYELNLLATSVEER